jgi:phospholipid-binding lipoprotein MlaA
MRVLRLALVVGCLLAAAACAPTVPSTGPTAEAAALRNPLYVHDPLERFNRGVYWFNADFDRKLYLPIVRAYRYVIPDFVEDRVSRFFDNLMEVRNAANGLLQLRPEVASRAVIRFTVNSTVGLLGTFDVAGAMGVAAKGEDFGQTLGWWGVQPGPYLVLPVLGPSNFRDATGLAVDRAGQATVPPAADLNDLVYRNPLVYLLEAVDRRRRIDFSYYQTGSPFEYDLVRYLYTQKRRLDARN